MSIDPGAEELLTRIRTAYARCRTYRDTGVVETRFEPLAGEPPPHVDRKPFATWLVRPDRFRFEFAEEDIGPEDEWHRMVILRDAALVRSRWTVCPGERDHPTLEHALGGAKGVSGSASWTVPALLLPEVGDGLGRLTGARMAGRREIDGVTCDGIAFADRHGERGVLWVGCEDRLLRRIEEEMLFDEAVLRELEEEVERWRASLPLEERARQAAADAEHPCPSGVRQFRTRTVTRYRPERDVAIDACIFESLRSALEAPRPAPPPLRSPDARTPSASEILARVRAAYARCTTFRDAGTTADVALEADGSRRTISRWAFSFAFQRPDRLRFESAYVDPTQPADRNSFVLVRDGTQAFRKDTRGGPFVPEPDRLPHLRRAFLSLALLFPDGPDALPFPPGATVLGLQDSAGHECFVLRGARADGRELTLWISRADALVRRCVHVEEFEERSSTARERIEQRLAGQIPDEERRMLEMALRHLERPPRRHRYEVTAEFHPEPDAEIDERTFARD